MKTHEFLGITDGWHGPGREGFHGFIDGWHGPVEKEEPVLEGSHVYPAEKDDNYGL